VRSRHRLLILMASLQSIWLVGGPYALAQSSQPSTPAPTAAPAQGPAPGTTGGAPDPMVVPGGPSAEQLTAPGALDQRTLPSDEANEAARAGAESSDGAESLLTPEERAREKVIPLTPVPTQSMIPIGEGRLPPIKLEASYNQPVGVREALQIALENSLPIKIAREGWNSNRFLFYSALGRFLPDLNQVFRAQRLYPDGGATTTTRTFSTTVRFPVFQGGRVMYGAMVNYHRMKGAQFAYLASVNDALLNVYSLYNQLLLNQVLLQIRYKSVEVSRAQLRLNQQLKNAGTGTNFAVMQSTTQLALDRQAMLQQQVAVRQSSLQLAAALNMNVGINLMPLESRVIETRLVDPNLNIQQLIDIAIRNRPELHQSNENRLAQQRAIQVALSNMMPTVQFFLSANRSESNRGGGGGGAANLGSLIGTGAAGAGQGGSNVVGVGPLGIGGAATTTVIPAGGGGGAGIAVGGSTNRSFTAGMDINWNLQGMGVPDAMTTLSSRALARQAMLQYNQTVIQVLTQVRSSYLNTMAAQEQVDVTGEAVIAAQEGLRLANLRLQHGVGTNLELIQAQRDMVTALINQAQAIINYNTSQAQLLRDIGQITVATLTTETPRAISHAPLKSKFFN
jgi:outer membrane protein TolC